MRPALLAFDDGRKIDVLAFGHHGAADVEADTLKETPRRVADAYAELLTPQPFGATTFPNDDA